MATDSLNRRGAGGKEERARKKQQQTANAAKRKLQEAVDEELSASQRDTVLQSLRDAMPTILLRFLFTAVVVAFTAIAVTVYLPAESATSGLLLTSARSAAAAGASTSSKNAGSSAPTVQVLASYPHDPDAFTQGLFIAKQGDDKFFIESTGLFGKSTLRKVAIESGDVLAKYDLPTDLFGEGVTLSENGEVVMLTWKSRRGFVFHVDSSRTTATDASTFSLTREFEFNTVTGEGWGIDSNGSHLLVTDGSSTIMFWDPKTMREMRRVDVRFQSHAISQLNEIEFANGFIYANIWFQAVIVKIDPQSGDIVSVFDCAQLMDPSVTRGDHNAVLNGIAYDADEDVFYVTGKLWNTVYKVRLLD